MGTGYTYPPAAPTITGDVTAIHRLLKTPALIARRLRTLSDQRYIADALLTGRFSAQGGSITYETGEPIFADGVPAAVAPGSEYELDTIGGGPASLAKTVKWGKDALITDESISRTLMNPVNRAFTKLVNSNVRHVDSVSMSAITSRVTTTQAAAAAWAGADAEQILTDVMTAKARIIALNEGFMPDTVVVDDLTFAYALAKFIAAGYLPRESDRNPVVTGDFPVIQGMRWLATPNGFANTALVVDTDQLGGMADEDLQSPGYSRGGDGVGVEVKSMRDDDRDGYRVRARRVTVPVVLEPAAARKITGI